MLKEMTESVGKFPTKTKPPITPLQSQAFSSVPPKQNMYKSSRLDTSEAEKMAPYTPIEIGTKGTVGSLIKQELEYFSRLELNFQDKPEKPKSQITDMATSSNKSIPTTVSIEASRKKKKRGRSRLLPSICSAVDVSDNNRSNRISNFSYKNLKSDIKNLQA
ncbi:Delta-hexatoxin-Mg1a like [Quillaja saponaria]|uniref:Delta-hexatoxin-Mg1a like n=1 Tax=Quillaja saponaria TaxID=32244 RepID=A0AAD7PMZ3_QUISA|nr:Delta-hexatoxin-Mg1a like [Quillaja saponaria]